MRILIISYSYSATETRQIVNYFALQSGPVWSSPVVTWMPIQNIKVGLISNRTVFLSPNNKLPSD